jgi:hypothetical protein
MRTIPIFSVAIFLACSAALSASDSAGGAPSPEAMAKAMAKMQPGPEHQELAKMAGSWDVASSFWMDPSAPPQQSKDTATFSVILNGRYVRQDYHGQMMGKPFNGIGIDGYDNNLGTYTSVWIDDMSTAAMVLHGKKSSDGKSITFEGDVSDCMTGGTMHVRSVATRQSDDAMSFEMFCNRGGTEQKSMELRYTRQKGK